MRNVYKLIVLFVVIVISQEVEITTFEPPNSSVRITEPIQHEIRSSLPGTTNSTSGEIVVTTTEDYIKAQTVLEYKPLEPFHQPLPVNQLVPPEKPNPTQHHEAVKPTKPSIQTLPLDLIERFPELTTLNKRSSTPTIKSHKEQETATNKYLKPATVLNYKPITSFHHPHPITPAQIVPPGKPWPASAEGYETTLRPELVSRKTTTKLPHSKKTKPSRKTTTSKFSTTKETPVKPITVLEYEPITTFFHPHPVTVAQLIPPGKPWPASSEDYQTTKGSSSSNLEDSFPASVSTTSEEPTLTSLHHSNPATVAQIIPPGKPWPASPENYQTTNSPVPTTILEDSVTQWVSTKTTTSKTPPAMITDKTTKYVESQTVLEYKPITSFHHPHPVTIAQLIPPGKPWPASAEENKTNPPTVQTLPPDLISRFPELTSKTSTYKPTTSSVTLASSTRLILTYKPQRPWYYPRPSTIGQIIPPGKPWPASASEYPSFTVTTQRPWLKDSTDKDTGSNELEYYKPDELQQLEEERRLEPNALQYFGASITAPPRYNNVMTPFTSGTQKTTISDIVDIFQEVHNISLISGNAPPAPSHLLPFDIDKGPGSGSTVVRRPPSQGYQQNNPPVQVYDGTLSLGGSGNRERIFPNPKVVPQY